MTALQAAIQAMLDVQAAANRLAALEAERTDLQERVETLKARIRTANTDLDAAKDAAKIALKEAFGAI